MFCGQTQRFFVDRYSLTNLHNRVFLKIAHLLASQRNQPVNYSRLFSSHRFVFSVHHLFLSVWIRGYHSNVGDDGRRKGDNDTRR